MPEVTIDVWSDVVCPWCFIGKRRLDTALAAFEHRDAVTVQFHSFQLDPHAPRESAETLPERTQRDLGLATVEEASRLHAQVTALAAAEGLVYRLDRARLVNTYDAHRLLHFAAQDGRGEALQEQMSVAYTGEGAVLSDHDTLVALATDAGLDPAAARTVLAGDAFADAVASDRRRAQAVGITGVPAFLIGGRYLITGAQPAATLAEALRRVWNELTPARP
ncbi:DsbA family oxidoreductase [Actinopolymorpha alba]|uniref:DsbA family oxidoreductase n=1 Tax=Actinopolymorpha alba TaxID=533267 RepID=UPI0003731B4F|nr:DsbA family oxidoreductase [Actinopolymorpha alba]